MKKLYLAISLFFLISILGTQGVHAQTTYKCSWEPMFNTCVSNPPAGCSPQDNTACLAKKNEADCSASPAHACAASISVTCSGTASVNTAIGCIPYGNSTEFAGFFLRWGIGIGGGIAFLLIVYASFLIMSSSGNPERLKSGQELLTAAIMGLIMLIFSIFILKFIGVDILGIPGLST
ncbi:hypothetical protein HY045_04015 [Candidatus Woesebacteria bacterium]|nr:hypothetical protein [Candidatus Woesebacteria bacterium]